jgi:hypothetical protein
VRAAIAAVPTAPKNIANASEMEKIATKTVTVLIVKMRMKAIFSQRNCQRRQRKEQNWSDVCLLFS